MKDVRSQGGRVQCGQGEGVLQMRTSALFGAINFEIYGVSARTRRRGVEPVRTFFGQGGGGQFFAILCGRLLWTAPYGDSMVSSI